jgi:hypothetical protein
MCAVDSGHAAFADDFQQLKLPESLTDQVFHMLPQSKRAF